MKGLIIDEPWIGFILRREKTWEMRAKATTVRGRIALIRKGSGTVVGCADLVDSIGPLDPIACRAHRDMHRIPNSQDAALLRWNHAWVLENARPLVRPVPYEHPNGAVIWVNLAPAVAEQILPDHGLAGRAGLPRPVRAPLLRQGASTPTAGAPPRQPGDTASRLMVPVARCGSWFGPHLTRNGKFRVGAKGEEETYARYPDALDALRRMAVPRWRRPNGNGNWGIVAGVRWALPDELSLL